MRRLFLIVPLWLLLMTLGLIAYKAIPKRPPIDAYIADLQEQCDSLGTEVSTLRDQVKILNHHLDKTGE